MPQNPFDIFKQLPLRNVPKPTDDQQIAWDAQVREEQAQDPSVPRDVFEGLMNIGRGFMADDPSTIDPETSPWTRKMGMAAGMLPISVGSIKKLPIIAPEAYRDVKAGGLKLYSRLTDAFAKAPKMMHVNKARDIAKQGASSEEIGLRKLEEFFSGRDPNAKLPREEVMSHLAANPLELNVTRYGGDPIDDAAQSAYTQALEAENRFRHELDTRYGTGWQGPMLDPERAGLPGSTRSISQAEWDQFTALENARINAEQATDRILENSKPKYDWLQTPGPKENYGESLINLPRKNEALAKQTERGLTEDEITALNNETFSSSHWDEPNNLVWSRHNDRMLEKPFEITPGDIEAAGSYEQAVKNIQEAGLDANPSWGRFVEEIQSDWHQKGRDLGYKGDPYPEYNVYRSPNSGLETEAGPLEEWYYADRPNQERSAGRHAGGGETPEEAIADANNYLDAARVPDAPFKDTYHELALKQQLLDAANDPELEWLGVADADTVSRMEGHDKVKPGTELYYNQKHPSALEKLLSPLGGSVEKAVLPGLPADTTPLGGMWKANLTPEIKQLIKERGFPALAALMALLPLNSLDNER